MIADRQLVRKLAVAVCFSLAFALGASTHADAAGPACGTNRVVHDFLAPLAKMPAIHRVPAKGKLPFAPAGLTLEGSPELVVGPAGSVGFSVSDEAVGQRRTLNWLVQSTLYRVNGRGISGPPIERTSRRLGTVQWSSIKSFVFDVVGTPAFYRVDIAFRRLGTNRLLGTFSQYARVMRPHTDLDVVVDQTALMPGEVARARIVNNGTSTLESSSYDFGFSVQRFDGIRWITVPESPLRGKVPKRMQFLPPGAENRGCLRYLIPGDQPLGRYRFVAGMLSAEFEVRHLP